MRETSPGSGFSDQEHPVLNKKSRTAKLQRHLVYHVSSAVRDYAMIEDGDHVMVCHSGGKDSFALLDLLIAFKKKSPLSFDITAVNIDQKLPGFPEHVLPRYFGEQGVSYRIIEQDIYGTVKRTVPEGKTMCGLCSRLRRGALYRFAEENGMTKIALGHHRDDIVETLFLNMFYGGKLKAMPPKLLTDNKKNIVIRPMAYIDEREIEKYSALKVFPVIPGNLCGEEEAQQRRVIKRMLQEWKKAFPGRIETIFNSIKNVEPSQLADMNLFDFEKFKV